MPRPAAAQACLLNNGGAGTVADADASGNLAIACGNSASATQSVGAAFGYIAKA